MLKMAPLIPNYTLQKAAKLQFPHSAPLSVITVFHLLERFKIDSLQRVPTSNKQAKMLFKAFLFLFLPKM